MNSCQHVAICKGIFDHEFSAWRAEEAWPRSEHTRSSLPEMLRGKSPCLGAESATGRPEGRNPGTDSDATCGVVVLGVWPFATAKLCREHLQKCQQNGAHSLHALLLQLCHTWVFSWDSAILRYVDGRLSVDEFFHFFQCPKLDQR